MKKSLSILSAALLAAASVIPSAVSAADDEVYGTMQIPYADFYAAELNNSVAVDAVSSATANKWNMTDTGSVQEDGSWKNGGLCAGTYNDGAGKILGVVYPVCISQADLDSLTDKYNFTALDTKPAAYKPVTVEGGKASFGKLVDSDGEETLGGEVKVSTRSNYGDYQISVSEIPQNADIYGVIVKTSEGTSYGMRALENIWRNGAISWGAGVKEKESHGNVLSSEHYKSSQGQTITEVTFITLGGYSTVSGQNVYLPVKVADSVSVENGKAGSGSTTFDNSVFPSDYAQTASVAEGFTVSGNTISYTNAKPGSYTLTVSDSNGKYSDVSGNFQLTTSDIPVKYADGKLVAADGFTADDAANFLKNITSVNVGENTYRTGRRGVTIVDPATGEIKMDAKSGDTNVFAGVGKYSISVTATGYSEPYNFEIDTNPVTTSTTSTTNKSAVTTTTASKSGSKSASKTTSKSDSPKTGDTSAAMPIAALAAAGVCAAAFSKRRK